MHQAQALPLPPGAVGTTFLRGAATFGTKRFDDAKASRVQGHSRRPTRTVGSLESKSKRKERFESAGAIFRSTPVALELVRLLTQEKRIAVSSEN